MPRGGARGNKDEDDTFESADSGSSKTYPKQCSALRKNEICMIKGKPCKIVDMSTSKTGKHGHAKVHLVGIDIFDGKKYEDICPSTHNMEVPFVSNKTYQLVDISDEDFAELMDEKTAETREDLKLPDDDVGKNIEKEFNAGKDVFVVVTEACGQEKIITCKVGNK